MKEVNFNRIAKQSIKNSQNTSAFENTKAVYESYVKKISKTDFANSITRYQIEIEMLKSMKEMAEKFKLTKELELIETKIKTAENNLAKWGIKNK